MRAYPFLSICRGEKPLPPGPGQTADVPLYASLYRDTFSLFRDLSGMSLHRRGYRDAMHKSPLNEAAAAGILLMAGWKELSSPSGKGGSPLPGPHGLLEIHQTISPAVISWSHFTPPFLAGNDAVLVDPMCGSGTLLSEAALIALNAAPGLMRPSKMWPFRKWPDADKQAGRSLFSQGVGGNAHPTASAALSTPPPTPALLPDGTPPALVTSPPGYVRGCAGG